MINRGEQLVPDSTEAEEWLDDSHFIVAGVTYEIDTHGVVRPTNGKRKASSRKEGRPSHQSQIR